MFGLRFVCFLATILNLVRLFLLWEFDWNFAYVFLAAILNWNFRPRRSEVPTKLLNFKIDIYLFSNGIVFSAQSTHWIVSLLTQPNIKTTLSLKDVCQLEAFSRDQVWTHWLDSLLAQCYITVRDAGSTIKQHWVDVLCLSGNATVILIDKCSI